MRVIVVLAVLLCAHPALAQTVVQCSPAHDQIVREALDRAKALTITAATAVGDTPEYVRWFGAYSDRNAEMVRANLKGVVRAIQSGAVTVQCDSIRDDGCRNGEYAWVYPHEPYRIYLCPSFFTMPPLTALQPHATASNNGTREGTFIHELSHFRSAGRTDDHCYTRRICARMAETDPARAIDNADSYQYFTEDVIYYARQPVTGKTTP